MSSTPAKQRVAIVGGGMSALTAAFELAKLDAQSGSNLYDITVYQQGWRLGGKGASGRNTTCGHRIEEHGLHVWFGAYENAFRLMRDVYGRTPRVWPHGDLDKAFKAQYGFALGEKRDDGWRIWDFPLPPRSSSPGDAAPQGRCTPRHVVARLADVISEYYESRLFALVSGSTIEPLAALALTLSANALPTPEALRSLARQLGSAADSVMGVEERDLIAAQCLHFSDALALLMAGLLGAPQLPAQLAPYGDSLRRWWIIVTVGLAVIGGTMRSDAYLRDDWDELNGCDLKEWLRPQLGSQGWMADSALVEASYDLYFSYPEGNSSAGSIEAGTMIRAAIWLLLEYKGAFMWRMRNGMGDSIFAPLYSALVSMGVKFEFFHKVTKLHTDGARITKITIDRQASLITESPANPQGYAPFVMDPQQRDCWPARPKFDLLTEGDRLRTNWNEFDLESDWSTWTSGLSALDVTVDRVILGVPPGVIETICVDLPTLRPMLGQVKTVQTQALQLWINRPLAWLQGARVIEPPLVTAFQNPIDTYADMTHLTDCERWPPTASAEHIAYFCGVLPDKNPSAKPAADPTYPTWAYAKVRQFAEGMFIGQQPPMATLWPHAFLRGGGMDWALLCRTIKSPAMPFEQQYLRANISASDRYVLAAAGTSKHRLKAGASGYSNLFLAGDWVYNGLFVGCIEGAVISGKQAARALSGSSAIEVVGEGTLFTKP